MLRALFLSILIHALLAAGLVLCLSLSSEPRELAQLDLTSVDLSFSETPTEAAHVAATPPPQQAQPPAPKPPETPPPPRKEPEPQKPSEPSFVMPEQPRPDDVREQLVTPEPLPEPKPKVERKPAPQPVAQPTPKAAPRQARVDAPPRAKRGIKPEYPREARQRGEQGNVTLELDISAQGSVTAERVLRSSGFPLLDEAAIKAVRAARFIPAKSGKRNVPSTATLTLEFKLK